MTAAVAAEEAEEAAEEAEATKTLSHSPDSLRNSGDPPMPVLQFFNRLVLSEIVKINLTLLNVTTLDGGLDEPEVVQAGADYWNAP